MPRGVRQTVTIGGVEYESISAAAHAFGITVPAMSRRIRRGNPSGDPALRRTSAKPVEIDGVRYPSHNAAAEALGIKPATLSARIAARARGVPEHPKPVVIGGVEYKSMAEAGKALVRSAGIEHLRALAPRDEDGAHPLALPAPETVEFSPEEGENHGPPDVNQGAVEFEPEDER